MKQKPLRTGGPVFDLKLSPHLALALLALAACAPAPRDTPAEPWTVAAVQPDTTDGVRILVVHDMEGLAGQSDPNTFDFGTPVYPRGQEMLAADLNAVIEGLFAGGATEVHVVDGHGSGNPEPDVRRDLLDPRAEQVLHDFPFDTYFDLIKVEGYDAVAVVGMHAKTGSGGFASHTYTLGIDFWINGHSITETELVGLSWGRKGIPVIFASGDDRLANDLQTMPWIEYVTVKTALSADSAAPRPVAQAHADMTAGATRAVENLLAGRAMAMRVSEPITATLRAVPPASLELLDGVPGIQFEEDRVTFAADSLRHAYDGLTALVRVATRNYIRIMVDVIRPRPDSRAIFDAYGAALEQRWFDVESGRWQPPARPEAPTGGVFHGYQ